MYHRGRKKTKQLITTTTTTAVVVTLTVPRSACIQGGDEGLSAGRQQDGGVSGWIGCRRESNASWSGSDIPDTDNPSSVTTRGPLMVYSG